MKYRAWKFDGEYSHMITSAQGVITAIKNCYNNEGITEGTTGYHYVDTAPKPKKYILMQYIGLNDLYGIEIYDRDIVRFEDRESTQVGIVKKDCYQFYIEGITSSKRFSFDDFANTKEGTAAVEVIGNPFENPEFLKVA